MNNSQKNSKISLIYIAALISMVSLASWQFYEYASFKHDNGLVNIEGGASHLVLALILAFLACCLGFFIASKLLRYQVDNELHITAPPSRSKSPGK